MGQDFPRYVEGYDKLFMKRVNGTIQYPNYLEMALTEGPGFVNKMRVRIETSNYEAAAASIVWVLLEGVLISEESVSSYVGSNRIIPFTGVTAATGYASSHYIVQAIVSLTYRSTLAIRLYPPQELGSVFCWIWIEGASGS